VEEAFEELCKIIERFVQFAPFSNSLFKKVVLVIAFPNAVLKGFAKWLTS
jgi:hypothetical protein